MFCLHIHHFSDKKYFCHSFLFTASVIWVGYCRSDISFVLAFQLCPLVSIRSLFSSHCLATVHTVLPLWSTAAPRCYLSICPPHSKWLLQMFGEGWIIAYWIPVSRGQGDICLASSGLAIQLAVITWVIQAYNRLSSTEMEPSASVNCFFAAQPPGFFCPGQQEQERSVNFYSCKPILFLVIM